MKFRTAMAKKCWLMRMHQIKIFYIFVPGLENLSLSSKTIVLDFKIQNISKLSNVLHLA